MADDLPRDRPFSRIEAFYSLHLISREKAASSISALARRWKWSRHAVRAALAEWGYSIEERTYSTASGVLATGSRQAKPLKNNNIASDSDRLPTGKTRKSSTPDLFPDCVQEANEPGFSAEFVAGPWLQWCRTKKGGNYPNAKARQRALDKLYSLSGGDEALATRALEESFHRNWMSFIYYHEFKQQDHEHPQPDKRGRDQSRQFAYGANNARRLADLLGGNSG